MLLQVGYSGNKQVFNGSTLWPPAETDQSLPTLEYSILLL